MSMSRSAFLVGGILPYLAVALFTLGVVYRLLVWRRVPQPALMTLYPTQGSGWRSLVREALFFPSLFRGDRTLWIFAWSFHVALALAFVGHLRIATGAIDRGLALLGIGAGGMATISAVAGGFAGVVLLATLLLLLGRRVFVTRVREISAAPDFLALFLLVAVITTGDLMRFGGNHVDLAATRAWAASLLAFSPAVALPPAVLLHLFCAELLLLYFSFSKLMHFGGFFFTFSLVKRTAP
jgi:nitrate reductase gamma subunit